MTETTDPDHGRIRGACGLGNVRPRAAMADPFGQGGGPYGAGGVTDTMARVTADRLTKALGQTFVIENKVGAGGAIGIDQAIARRRTATPSYSSAARCSPSCRWRRR